MWRLERMTNLGMIGRSRLDVGLAFVLALTLFLAIPLAMNEGLSAGSEVRYHHDRAAASPAEAPPATDFTGSLADHLSAVFQLLFGLSALDALRWILLISFLVCSGGMYLFCKRRSGPLGALIGGLLYVYSPYLMVTLAYARGAYPELLALALFPALLWRLDALRDKPGPGSYLLAVLLQAAIFNAHGTMALALTALALFWILFEALIQQFNREASQMDIRTAGVALSAMLLGMLAAADFWLPTVLGGEAAGAPIAGQGPMNISALLAPPPIQDAGALNGLRELHHLGTAQWTLALLGAASASLQYARGYRTRHPQAFLGAAFFAPLAAALINLSPPAAQAAWHGFGMLPYLQSDGRLLGPIAVCLAVVASVNGLWLERLEARYQVGAVALFVALPLATAMPLLYVPEWRAAMPTFVAVPGDNLAGIAIGDAGAATQVIPPLAAAVACLLAWGIRKWQPMPRRPYWQVARLSRAAVAGALLGAALASPILYHYWRISIGAP